MFLIGDLARRCGLSASALRFYDECGLLVPAGIDPASGYRQYAEGQAATAVLIRDLRAAGLGLSQVKEFLRSPDSTRRELLDRHEQAIAAHTSTTQRLLRQLRTQLIATEDHMTQTMDVDARQLRQGLQHMIAIASQDPERPLLQTVLLEAAEGSLRLVATDRHRLAVRDLASLDGAGSEFTALVPTASALRAVDALTDTGTATLAADEQHLRIRHDGRDIDLPKVAAQFVDYTSILEADTTSHVIIAPLPDTIDLLESKPAHTTVVLTFAPDRLDVDGVGLPASYSGPGIVLHLNPSYLLEALRAASGPDIALEASTELRPLTIRSADSGTSAHLLMPIKPDEQRRQV